MRTLKIRHLTLAAALMASFALTPAAADAASCPTGWGSGVKTRSGLTQAPLISHRAGRHDCYDRFVVELNGPVAGYTARYVSQVTGQGSGNPVPLKGGAFIELVVNAPASSAVASQTGDLVSVAGFRTFRQIKLAESFEGYTGYGIGVRSRLPMRVSLLPGPGSHSRLLIDVAHSW
ncbi:MAG: hypothetical protein JWM05_2849 [Acidimicrobiales bacterium]|nr:hypothetical protein [Acidimicrobiales bacterium]